MENKLSCVLRKFGLILLFKVNTFLDESAIFPKPGPCLYASHAKITRDLSVVTCYADVILHNLDDREEDEYVLDLDSVPEPSRHFCSPSGKNVVLI